MHEYDYKSLVTKWKETLRKVETFGGKVKEFIIEPPAREEEISRIEKHLGCSLPSSFKDILLGFSKHVEFNWYLPDSANLPHEFRDIFSGEIRWSLEDLEIMSNLMDWEEDDRDLRNKLQFLQVGNGDVLAFNLEKDDEQSIVYWSHEEDEFLHIADSFIDYIEKLTELHGVGSEIWQYERFIDKHGLNDKSLEAQRWREWFDTFAHISTNLDKEKLDSLICHIEYHGEITKENLKALKDHDESSVFNKVQDRLKKVDDCQREILYRIIGEGLGESAQDWVRGLWNNQGNISGELRSYLTAKCLPIEEGIYRVIKYVEEEVSKGEGYYVADKNLCYFKDHRVIDWIKGHISSNTTKDDWYSLYACSQPTWENIKEWLELGGKYRMVTINALEYMIRSWNPTYSYINGQYKITNPPRKCEIVSILEEVREYEILNLKKRKYNEIINFIDYII